MIVVSDSFKEAMELRRDFRCGAHVVFSDGTSIDLSDDDFSITGNSVTDGAGADGLPLGLAVGRSIEIELINGEGKLNAYSFAGASVELSLVFNEETVPLGVFTVVEPETKGSTVVVTATDDMYLSDKEYDTTMTFPATLLEIFSDACNRCDITYSGEEFRNSDFVIAAKPDNLTYRQVIGLVAMMAGGNARIGTDGEIHILSYDFDAEPAHVLDDWISLTVGVDDIQITGVSVTQKEYVHGTYEGETYSGGSVESRVLLRGENGYVINIDNPLIVGNEEAALDAVSDLFVGKSFRLFSGEHVAYPLAEFMDNVWVEDINGNRHRSVLTDYRFEFFGESDFKNSAAPAARINSTYQANTSEQKSQGNTEDIIAQIKRLDSGLVAEVAARQNLASITMTPDAVKFAIESAVNGIDSLSNIDSLKTTTGYEFGKDGLLINKTGDEISSVIDNDGLKVKRVDETVLEANHNGVNALNISVRKYLVVGDSSRFEDFTDEDGNVGTACFWIGG